MAEVDNDLYRSGPAHNCKGMDMPKNNKSEVALELPAQRRVQNLARHDVAQWDPAHPDTAQDKAERSSLENELRSRARQQEALAQLGERALVEPDLERLLNDAVSTVALM